MSEERDLYMYGIGIWNGLKITLKRFVDTFVVDLGMFGTKQSTDTFAVRQGAQAKGLYTVEYPEEKLAMPERFRFVPFLVVNNPDDPHSPGHDWCTSCGICAKVCPPQCIWIVRGTDAKTGRPKPEPEAFYIDIDICMNCGYCAEYCPFDAIKMDHDYELASYDRTMNHIYDHAKLAKPVSYWQQIAPNRALEEAEVRGQWEHKDTAKVAKKAGIPMTEPVWEKRDRAFHDPDIENAAAKPTAAAAPGAPRVAAPAAAGVSINVDGASPDQLAQWAANEGLPLPARSAAALKLEQMITEKTFKPSSEHRKAVSAAKKTAKDANTTIEESAASFKPGEVVMAATPAPAAAPVTSATPATAPKAATPAGVSINVEGATPDQLAQWAENEGLPLAARSAAAVKLDTLIREKTFKPASLHRKAISVAKKAAGDAGTTIEEAGSGFTPGAAIESPVLAAPPPVAEAVAAAEPSPVAAATAAAPAAVGETVALIEAAKELERKSKAKEIKLTSNDRKQIAEAKKLAQENGIAWE